MNIRERIKEYRDAYSYEYDECRDDLRFASLLHYDKPSDSDIQLVIDRITRIRNRIVNPCRINPFGFGVSFFGAGDPIKAARLNALFDQIQKECGAYSTYADALDIALMCGRAYIIVGTDYSDNEGLAQKIVVSCPSDPTSVYIDPSSERNDGSDAEHAAHIALISRSKAERIYGIAQDEDIGNIDILESFTPRKDNQIPIITSWRKRSTRKRMFYVNDGTTTIAIPEREIADMIQRGHLTQEMIIGDRIVSDTSIAYEVYAAEKLIDETVLPIRHVPVVPVYGRRVYLSDRITYKGIVYFLRDAQKLVNFAANAEAYRLNNAPSSPFIAEFEQVMDGGAIQRMWQNVNRERRGVLVYRRVDGVPEPHRVDVSIQTADIQATRKGIQQDIDEAMGFGASDFGGMLGAKTPSGLALSIMQDVSDYQTASWLQNLQDSVIQVGRIISDLAPTIYAEGIDVDYYAPNGERYHELVRADELTGNMRICITTSPDGEQKKRNGAQMLATLAGQNPEFARAFIDIILLNSGAKIPDDAIDRAKKMIPSHLTGAAPDPEAMQAMQTMQASMDEMAKTLEQYEAIISQLQAKIIGDTRKSEIEYIKEQLKIIGDLLIEQQKQRGKLDEIEAKAMADVIKKTSEKMIDESRSLNQDVTIKYRDPLDRFTPLVEGPLVSGNIQTQHTNGISP